MPSLIYREFTPVLDTSAYADGDILFVPFEIKNVFNTPSSVSRLDSIFLLDEDDQGVALDLLFYVSLVTLGTINVAPSITDAADRDCRGFRSISSSDYIDLGGSRIANVSPVGLYLSATSATTTTTSIWVAGITRNSTPTYTASGIKIKLGFLQA